ncbi:MAG: AzlD domain-containing protein [Oscillospiraceae bacterium]|nr:AzlD domain-containing protein [Oscillospiraceae bacterium]
MSTMIYIAVMAGVTYLIRMLPNVIFRKKITSPLIKSFLYYVPYATLGAMTIPAILYSTGDIITAAAGLTVAVILSLKERSLIEVAVSACAAAYITGLLLRLTEIVH